MRFFILMISSVSLFALHSSSNADIDAYLKFLKKYPYALGPIEGEVKILRDPKKIKQAQENQIQTSLREGLSKESAQESAKIGVITEDAFWVVVRDPVEFPSGYLGTYDRLLSQGSFKGKKHGSIILPVDERGFYGMIVTYRHPARSWEIELPKGAADIDESYQETAVRELKEETGLISDKMVELGEVAFATVSPVRPKVFLAYVQSKKTEKTHYDAGEAIYAVEWFDQNRMETAYKNGYAWVSIRGKKEKIPFRDPLLGHALMLAKSHKVLDF